MDLTENMVNQPGKEILFAHFASSLLKSGDLDKAIKVCEQGLKKYPSYAQAHYILARCYIRKKKNDEARAELERVLRYDPNHLRAIRDLAGLYFANEFQDLYREYLLQLFTLDPLNENVIQEAKKLGEFNLWPTVSEETISPEPESTPVTEPTPTLEPEIEIVEEKETVFEDPEKDTAEPSETDLVFPDKIDLSQFDNVEDDFTTILHGKLEYSGKINPSQQEKVGGLEDIGSNIIERSDEEDKAVESQDIDPVESSPTDDSPSSWQVKGDENPADSMSVNQEGSFGKSDQLSESEIPADLSQSSTNLSQGDDTDQGRIDEDIVNQDEFPDDEDEKFEQPKIISQTLGEILVSQQKYVEAKAVFEALKEKQPDNKALDLKIEYLDRIIGLEKKGKS